MLLLSSLENYTKELGVIGEQNDNNLSYSSLKVKYLKKSVNIYTFYWCLILFILVLLTFVVSFILSFVKVQLFSRTERDD